MQVNVVIFIIQPLHLFLSRNMSIRCTQIIMLSDHSELVDGADDEWTISNGEYKLIVNSVGMKELYNLMIDPYENSNLLSGTLSSLEQNAKTELETELANIRN